MQNVQLSVEGQKVTLPYNDHFANLVRISQSLNLGAANNYRGRNMVYVDVPSIVGITGACENVDTLFRIGNARVMQYILGEADIRNGSVFAMLNMQTSDWEKKPGRKPQATRPAGSKTTV